jgi:ankyrin repeat protein
MTTPSLTDIPVELLLEIAEHLSDSPAALSALCRTGVRFYNDLTPLLYSCTAGITSELKMTTRIKIYTYREYCVPPTLVTPLHRCASMGNTSAVERFLMVSGDHVNTYSKPVNRWNTLQLTPIFFAALSDNVATVAMLLSHGADPNLPPLVDGADAGSGDYGKPLDIAARWQNEEMISLLLRHGATSESALWSLLYPLAASPMRHPSVLASIAERLIAIGGSQVNRGWPAPNDKYHPKRTPLKCLMSSNTNYWTPRGLHTFLPVLRVLLRAGANLSYDLTDDLRSEKTVLNNMIRNGCVEIVAAILEDGRNVDLNMQPDLQPLQLVGLLLREGHFSEDGRLVDIARMLLRAGARADAGEPTPLMLVDPEWKFFWDSSCKWLCPQKPREPLKLNPRMESRICSFVALLKAYSAPGDPLVCPIVARKGHIPGYEVAGTRFLQSKQVLEEEQEEKQLMQRAAEFGL